MVRFRCERKLRQAVEFPLRIEYLIKSRYETDEEKQSAEAGEAAVAKATLI